MVEHQPSKLITRVRFPSPAPSYNKPRLNLGFLFVVGKIRGKRKNRCLRYDPNVGPTNRRVFSYMRFKKKSNWNVLESTKLASELMIQEAANIKHFATAFWNGFESMMLIQIVTMHFLF